MAIKPQHKTIEKRMSTKKSLSNRVLKSLKVFDNYGNLTLLQLSYIFEVERSGLLDVYEAYKSDPLARERAYAHLHSMSNLDIDVRLVEKFKPAEPGRSNCVCFHLTKLGRKLLSKVSEGTIDLLETLKGFGMRTLKDVRFFTMLQDGPIGNESLMKMSDDYGMFCSRSVLCKFTHNASGKDYGNCSRFSSVAIIETLVVGGNNKLISLSSSGKALSRKAYSGYKI